MHIYIYIYTCIYIYIHTHSYGLYVYIYFFWGSEVPAFSYARVREKVAEPKTVPEAGMGKVKPDCT